MRRSKFKGRARCLYSMGQGCWWRLFGRCIVPLNWRTKTNRQYIIVAQANRSARGHIIIANCTPIFYWRWATWTIWHSKSMTICVASNGSTSPPVRWLIFVRGQGIGKGRRWQKMTPIKPTERLSLLKEFSLIKGSISSCQWTVTSVIFC